MNKAILLGRLGRDPETRFTNSGQPVSKFSIATDESWTDKAGVKQKKTEWHNCVAWGKTGENIAKFFRKGGIILVEGKIQTREWEDKEGAKRRTTEIVVFTFGFAGNNGAGSETARADQSNTAATEEETHFTPQEIADDDIPF